MISSFLQITLTKELEYFIYLISDTCYQNGGWLVDRSHILHGHKWFGTHSRVIFECF